jgi:hypothetical protein
LLACCILLVIIMFEPDIWQDFGLDIRYPALLDIRPDNRSPAFRLAGNPVSRISGQISIRCIPNFKHIFWYMRCTAFRGFPAPSIIWFGLNIRYPALLDIKDIIFFIRCTAFRGFPAPSIVWFGPTRVYCLQSLCFLYQVYCLQRIPRPPASFGLVSGIYISRISGQISIRCIPNFKDFFSVLGVLPSEASPPPAVFGLVWISCIRPYWISRIFFFYIRCTAFRAFVLLSGVLPSEPLFCYQVLCLQSLCFVIR